MAKHPLDISTFLGLEPQEEPKPKKTFKPKQKQAHQQKKEFQPNQAKPRQETRSHQEPSAESKDAPRIEKQYWHKLNPESRRIFTSRMWKEVDFNPMLSELTDLSKLTEKWLRWAIPTYVNGMKGGPIKDWFEGERGDRDFHYVLVGEHLKHLKEVRQKRKEESQVENAEQQETTPETVAEMPVPTTENPPQESEVLEQETPTQETEVIEQEIPPQEAVIPDSSPETVAAEGATPEAAEIETSQEVEETESSEPTPVSSEPQEEEPASPELKMALGELDDHIQWFQNYLDGNPKNNEVEKS